jgi:hypothetical protein
MLRSTDTTRYGNKETRQFKIKIKKQDTDMVGTQQLID